MRSCHSHWALIAFLATSGCVDLRVPEDVRISCTTDAECAVTSDRPSCVSGFCRPAGITGTPVLSVRDDPVSGVEDTDVTVNLVLTGVALDEAFVEVVSAPERGSLICDDDVEVCAGDGCAPLSTCAASGYQLVYRPAPNLNGTDSFTVRAVRTDAADITSDDLVVELAIAPVNDQPVIDGAAMPWLILQGDTKTFSLSATDVDGDDLFLSLREAPALGALDLGVGEQRAFVDGQASITFTAPGAESMPGVVTLPLSVIDAEGPTEFDADVEVRDQNAGPSCITEVEGTCGTITLDEDAEEQLIDLGTYISDAESDPFTCEVVGAFSLANIETVGASSVLTLSTLPDVAGQETLSLSCDDTLTQTSLSLVVDIRPINDAPRCPACPALGLSIEEDAAGPLVVDLLAEGHVQDVEGEAVSCSVATPAVLGSASFAASSATLTYAPDPDANGMESLAVACADATGASVDLTMGIEILPVRDQAVVIPVAALSLDEDAATLPIFSVTASDPDGEMLSFELWDTEVADWIPALSSESAKTNLGLVTVLTLGTNEIALTYAPDPNANGDDAITIRAVKPDDDEDAYASDPVDIAVTIAPVPDPPVVQVSTVDLLAGQNQRTFSLEIFDPDGPGETYDVVVTQPPTAPDPFGINPPSVVGQLLQVTNPDEVVFERTQLFKDAEVTVEVTGDDGFPAVSATFTVRALGHPSCAYARVSGSQGAATTGVHLIDPNYPEPPVNGDDQRFFAHCDMEADGGGWTLVLRSTGSAPGPFDYGSAQWFNRVVIGGAPDILPIDGRLASYDSVPFDQLLIGASPTGDPKAMRYLTATLQERAECCDSLYDALTPAESPDGIGFALDTIFDAEAGEEQGDPWRRLYWVDDNTGADTYAPGAALPPMNSVFCPAYIRPGPAAPADGDFVPRIGISVSSSAVDPTNCFDGDQFLGLGGNHPVVSSGSVSTPDNHEEPALTVLWVRDDDFTRLPSRDSCAAHGVAGAVLNGTYLVNGASAYCGELGPTTFQVCGNGIQEGDEACDDGNGVNDGCANNCTLPTCGNGIEEPTAPEPETCDDGNQIAGDGCDANCQVELFPPVCGDTNPEGAEECDDGNESNSDACTNQCRSAICGDGYVRLGVEACDNGNNYPGGPCAPDCTHPVCGNGLQEPSNNEQCDDGNTANNDGCSATCQIEPRCGNGILEPGNGEQCDPGDGNFDGICCAVGCIIPGGGG